MRITSKAVAILLLSAFMGVEMLLLAWLSRDLRRFSDGLPQSVFIKGSPAAAVVVGTNLITLHEGRPRMERTALMFRSQDGAITHLILAEDQPGAFYGRINATDSRSESLTVFRPTTFPTEAFRIAVSWIGLSIFLALGVAMVGLPVLAKVTARTDQKRRCLRPF